MNQDPPLPFDTVGDEHVEARIVAWVLGEASAFEAAELERLCEERPELLVFRRRIEAVHGLLGEAHTSEANHSWKLTPSKRQSVEEKFGWESAALPDSGKERRIRQSGRRAILAIAACVILTVVVGGLMMPGDGMKGRTDIRGGTASELRTADAKPENLARAIRDQEDKVEERRKTLAAIVRTRGIINRGSDSFYQSGVDEDKPARDALETYNGLLQQKLQTESQITSLLKYTGDQLMVYASGLDLPENSVKNLYPQYLEATRQLNNLKIGGLADSHPTVRSAAQETEAMKRQLDEGVVNLRATLQAQLELATDRLQKTGGMKDDTREDAIKRGLDAQDYVEAKRNFESDEQLLQTMKLRQAELANGLEKGILDGPAAPATTNKSATPEVALRARVVPAPQSSARPAVEMAENESQRAAGLKADEPAPAAAPAALSELAESLPRQATQPSEEKDAWGSRLGLNDEAQAAPAPAEPHFFSEYEPPATETASDSKPRALAVKQNLPSLPQRQENGASGGGGRGLESGDRDADRDKVVNRMTTRQSQAGVAGEKDADGVMGRDKAIADADTRQSRPELAGPTPGLRSGDAAINRSSIDAILNNPGRPAEMPAEGEGKKSLAGKDFAKAKSSATDAAPPPTLAAKAVPATASPRPDDEPQLAQRELQSRAKATDYADARREPAKLNKSLLEEREMGNRQNVPNQSSAGERAGSDGVEDVVPSDPATTDEKNRADDQARRGLDSAEGNFNLGKFDESKKAYIDVLRKDPTNSAARQGLERVETAKSDYYRAAYDHTRAELLSQVDTAWELSVPAENAPVPDSGVAKDGSLYFYQSADEGTKAEAAKDAKFVDSMDVAGYSLKLLKDEDQPIVVGGLTLTPEAAPKLFTESLTEGESFAVSQKPVVNPADLMEETAAAENPYSTFSLNISDASFQLAKAALAKGERPDPAAIKVEQFYNAVDYGDPGPAANEPVAATVEQSAHPVIPGRNLVRVALRTASAGRSAAQPLRLTLLVDQSGSMVREDRRAAMEQAVKQLGGLLTANDKITVIGFSRTSRLLADGLTGDQGASLDGLINQTASEGGTNLEEAMKLGAQLAARHQLAGAQNRIVLFTDGAANLGNPDHEKLSHEVEALRQKGIAFDVAGIGGVGLNDRLLAELARHGNGRYYVVDDAKDQSFGRQLAGAFRPAAENVKVQVNFNPQRVGRYKLIGFEKDRLQTEDFRNDAVDAAELAADEAGVAIYQVEPLAGGTGEIGEVSVRFKDTASGEMVERGWTIPYETAAAFDRATPSMQLAGLSMLAAEKLKGGPLADATDLKQLAGPEALVKQFYGSSARVGEMLRVIDALK